MMMRGSDSLSRIVACATTTHVLHTRTSPVVTSRATWSATWARAGARRGRPARPRRPRVPLGAARPQPARPRRAATERRPRATGTRFALPKLHAHANSALSQTRIQRQRLLSISSLKKSSASWSEGMLVLAAMLSVTSQPTAGTRMRTHARTRSLSASATGGFKEVSCGPL